MCKGFIGRGDNVIEGLLQIGSALPTEGCSLSNFIEELEPIKKGRQLNVFKLDFDLLNEQVKFDTNEEMENSTARKYNYIGSGNSRAAQWYTSSSSINYFISETIYNLSQLNMGESLNKEVKEVLEKFFYKLDKGLDKKYSYLLDINKHGISNKTIEEIYDETRNESKIGPEILKVMTKELENYLKERYNQKFNDFGLFVLQINGQPISLNKNYIERVIESKNPLNEQAGDEKLNKGICSSCGAKDMLTSNFANTKIKIFTTNLNIFASYFNKEGYYKNMQLCQSCLMKLMAGENYTMNYLDTKLSTFNVYIIPQFVYGEPMDKEDLDYISGKIVNSFNTVKSYESIRDLKDELIEIKDNYFLLNFLFYRRSQASTKVQALVKDVSPSIFDRISEALIQSNHIMTALLGDKWKYYVTLNTIYYMHPIKLNNGSPTQYRDVLQSYDHIFTGKKLNVKHSIENIADCIKIIKLEKPSYNIDTKNRIEFYMLQANGYLKFLREMNCLGEGQGVEVDTLMVKDDIKKFISEMKYNEEQTAMFLLGTLIGEIGNAQYDPSSDSKNKPILNKINWNGVDKSKLIRLTKDVFSKLNQEKIRHFHERTFSEMKRILDKNINNWSMNKDENLFYILSGYSYATVKPILKGDMKNEK